MAQGSIHKKDSSNTETNVDNPDKYEDDNDSKRILFEQEDIVDYKGRLLVQQPDYDQIINAELHFHYEKAKCPSAKW